MAKSLYYIVKAGATLVGNNGSASFEGICSHWAAAPNQHELEVVEGDLTGKVVRRYEHTEAAIGASRVN
jgi:hypothetical protein